MENWPKRGISQRYARFEHFRIATGGSPRKMHFGSARLVLGIVALLTISSICAAQLEQDSARPKIGLVLSGGGARGAAHVGVIKVLDELRIPIDYIAGTSMGAIVGGLYASGLSASELEEIILTADWPRWLSDRPPRAQRSYRRKADDYGFLVEFDVGVNEDGLILPQGIVQGQNFTMALRRWLLPVATVKDFDQLPIPFVAIATNLLSGEEVILKSGDLPMAIRASMSVPGVFKPVRIGEQILVDGAVANNLPVGMAKTMGADILIVVDVGSPLMEEAELDSPLQVSSQMMNILVQARTEEQKRLMKADDVLITPALGLLSSQAFDQSTKAMRIGEVAARETVAELRRYSLPENTYVAHRKSVQRTQSNVPVIHTVEIRNESKLSTKVLDAYVSEQTGATVDLDQLESDITDIYGFDTFETVDYSIEANDAENTLLIESRAKTWGPNYLRFGLNLEDDFSGHSTYNLAARFTKAEMNAKGGEFQADIVVGEHPQLAAEFYQPLDYHARWFVNPRLRVQHSNTGLFDSGEQITQLRSEETEVSLAVGRVLSNWGELRMTLSRSYLNNDVRIGDPAQGRGSTDLSRFGLGIGYDTIDRIAIPRFGTNLQIGWAGLRNTFGGDLTADITQLSFLKPQTWGRNTLLHWWDFSHVNSADDQPLDAFGLGGLFSLSGYARNELLGDYRAIGRLLYYRRLSEHPLSILDTSVYVGASLELGNVWRNRSDVSISNALTAGSVFVTFDSVVGPLYLAYGIAEGGRHSAYLFLGQTF